MGSIEPLQTGNLNMPIASHLHYGYKLWIVIPPIYHQQVKMAILNFYPNEGKEERCTNFLHHKHFVLSLLMLKEYRIPLTLQIQRPGQTVFIYPGAMFQTLSLQQSASEKVHFRNSNYLDMYGELFANCSCKGGGKEENKTG